VLAKPAIRRICQLVFGELGKNLPVRKSFLLAAKKKADANGGGEESGEGLTRGAEPPSGIRDKIHVW
jgi:hypothetical protein